MNIQNVFHWNNAQGFDVTLTQTDSFTEIKFANTAGTRMAAARDGLRPLLCEKFAFRIAGADAALGLYEALKWIAATLEDPNLCDACALPTEETGKHRLCEGCRGRYDLAWARDC
jgi:hypothetical protein